MRLSFWDKWKGLGIIAVVLVHASNSTASFPIGSINNDFGLFLRQLINFPVGLFIFLAALFVAQSKYSSEGYWVKVSTRIWRLALPFLVWSFIYFGMKFIKGTLIIEDIPLMISNGQSVSVGYFVIVMIQMSIISPFLERLNISQLNLLLILSFLLSIGETYTLKFVYTESLFNEFPYYALPFLVWLPFYVGGLICGRKGEGFWQSIGILGACLAYVFCVLLSVAESTLLLQNMQSFAMSQLKATSILTAGAICLIVVGSWVYGKSGKENILSWLGQRSFYFYLSHMLILRQTTQAVEKIGLIYENQFIFVLLVTLITLIIASIGAIILDRLFSHHPFYRRALGLS